MCVRTGPGILSGANWSHMISLTIVEIRQGSGCLRLVYQDQGSTSDAEEIADQPEPGVLAFLGVELAGEQVGPRDGRG